MLNANGRQGPCLHGRDVGNRLRNNCLIERCFDAIPCIRRQGRQLQVVAFGAVFVQGIDGAFHFIVNHAKHCALALVGHCVKPTEQFKPIHGIGSALNPDLSFGGCFHPCRSARPTHGPRFAGQTAKSVREMDNRNAQIVAVSHQLHGDGMRFELRFFGHVRSKPGRFWFWQRDKTVPVAIQQFNRCEEDAFILATEPKGTFLMQSKAVGRRHIPATLVVFGHRIGVGGGKSPFRSPRNQRP